MNYLTRLTFHDKERFFFNLFGPFSCVRFLVFLYFFSFGVTGRRQKVVNRTSISTLGTHMNGEEESVNGDMTCKYGTHQFTGSD